MFRHLPLVLRNALRNRRRSLLTIASIGASLSLLAVLISLYFAFFLKDQSTPESALRLIVRNRVSLATVLPVSYGERIRHVPGVKEVMVLQWFGGRYKDERDIGNFFARFSVDPEKLFVVYPDYRIAEDEKQAFLRDRTGCVIGNGLASRMKFKIGDRITLVGDIFPVTLELTVRGVYTKDRDNENLFFHHKYMQEGLPQGFKDIVSNFVVLAETPADVPRVVERIDDTFHNSLAETKTETERAFELSFLSYLGDVKMFLIGISAALTFTLLLVSANTMAMSVRERIREIGILRTFGYARTTVLGLILAESVALGLAGGVLGLGLAAGIIGGLRHTPIVFVDLKALTLELPVIALCLGLAAFIGFVSSFVPAWSASGRPIVDALRFND